MKRRIEEIVQGRRITDGAGISLVRVLSNRTVKPFNPILMLDSFDSTVPEEYIAGFPMHPHRGIETISLISRGNMTHRDSLENEDKTSAREVQWMTAGSGILHEEKLPSSERFLGVQLWLYIPRKNKMTKPEYHSIKKEDIPEIPIKGGVLRLISGQYKEYSGFKGKYLPLDYYHIILDANTKFKIEVYKEKSVMFFLLSGDAKVSDDKVLEKSAVKLSKGTYLDIETFDESIEILFISSDPLGEPISWEDL